MTGDGVRDWARLYQAPLWLTAAFIVLLTVFALTPDPSPAAHRDDDTATEPTPAPGECIVCGIDQQCDPSSGRCVFIKSTPLPCVEGAKFDEKAGFCLPTGAPTPRPVAPTEPPFDFGSDEPSDPQFPDEFPGMGRNGERRR